MIFLVLKLACSVCPDYAVWKGASKRLRCSFEARRVRWRRVHPCCMRRWPAAELREAQTTANPGICSSRAIALTIINAAGLLRGVRRAVRGDGAAEEAAVPDCSGLKDFKGSSHRCQTSCAAGLLCGVRHIVREAGAAGGESSRAARRRRRPRVPQHSTTLRCDSLTKAQRKTGNVILSLELNPSSVLRGDADARESLSQAPCFGAISGTENPPWITVPSGMHPSPEWRDNAKSVNQAPCFGGILEQPVCVRNRFDAHTPARQCCGGCCRTRSQSSIGGAFCSGVNQALPFCAGSNQDLQSSAGINQSLPQRCDGVR